MIRAHRLRVAAGHVQGVDIDEPAIRVAHERTGRASWNQCWRAMAKTANRPATDHIGGRDAITSLRRASPSLNRSPVAPKPTRK